MTNVRVRPAPFDATHHLSLTGQGRTFGLRLVKGGQGIVESPATPTTVRINTAGAKFGDFDPSMAHIEQRDWSGGRGLENFIDDPTRFYDGDAWTLSPDHLLSALNWTLTSGYQAFSAELPGSMTWQALIDSNVYIARNFTPSTTYNSSNAYFWVRKIGNPGNLTLGTYSSAATAVPGATTASVVVASADHPDQLASLQKVTYSAISLSSANNYWAVASATTNDTARDHWEIGVNQAEGTGKASTNGTTWATIDFAPYYLIDGPGQDVKWHFFPLSSLAGTSQILHAATQDNTTAAASSIVRLTSTGTWSTMAITGSALTNSVITDVCVANNVAYFGRRGTGAGAATTSIYQFRIETSSNRGFAMATTSIGDSVHTFFDPVGGAQVYRAVSSATRMYRASTFAFGTTATWIPSSGIPIGDRNHPITDIEDYDNQMYVRTDDGLWAVKNDKAAKVNVGLDDMPSTASYVPMLSKELYLYLGWSFSLERLYGQGGTLDDIGPWRGAGLPSSRAGIVSCLTGVVGWVFAGIDAGSTGVSSVLAWDGRGWHEVFRAPVAGWRVQNLYFWSPPGTRGRLFISCGGKIMSIAFPRRSLNPSKDDGSDVGGIGLQYKAESHIVTPTIDMGSAALPKLFGEMTMRSKNLTSTGIEVRFDYQLDDEIGGSTWTDVSGAFRVSPEDTLTIRQGNVRAARFRYRMNTNNSSTPVLIQGAVLKAAARTPIKRRWTIRARTGTLQVDLNGAQETDPGDFYVWFQDAAVNSEPLHMHSKWGELDNLWVYAEPPVIRRTYQTPDGSWGADWELVLREV